MDNQELMNNAQNEIPAIINQAVAKADIFVRRDYLSVLDQAYILPLSASERRLEPGRNLRLIKLDSFVFDKDKSIYQKLKSVYGTLSRCGTRAVLVLDGKENKVGIYLGLFTENPADTSACFSTFLNAFNGTFPGCTYKNIKYDDARNLLNRIFPKDEDVSICAVSAVTADANGTQNNYAGDKLDALVDGMRGKPFTMVLLAEKMDNQELTQMRQSLESLHSQISPFQRVDITMTEGESDSYGINVAKSISRTMSISTSTSRGSTVTTGTSQNIQHSPDNSDVENYQAGVQVAGALLAMAANSIIPGSGDLVQNKNLLQSLFYGQSLSNLLMNANKLTGNAPEPQKEVVSEGSHTDKSENVTTQESRSDADGTSDTEGYNAGRASNRGKSMQRSFVNKSVQRLLENIDSQLHNFERQKKEGAFRLAAYFVAGDEMTAFTAANFYRSIVDSSGREADHTAISQWMDFDKTQCLMDYLRRGIHPVFSFGEYSDFPAVLAAQPITTSDLPYYFCIPETSLHGLEVAEHASFSREIVVKGRRKNDSSDKYIPLGCILHMGREEYFSPVSLNIDSLTSHLLVAGTTGFGKSNFCYQLLDGLLKKGIKTLIVEPAKGEYAGVFGGREGFRVYGTNPYRSPILRMNPFAFPKGILLGEHIEKLLSIFNAAWPMYSAMPGILKEAVQEIYLDKGFDMLMCEKPEHISFPSFQDLLEKLPVLINKTAYSAEVKGNYIGALVERVKSLTTNIYSLIFVEDEIGDEILFGENVIIDISRVGSAETKALIMGFVVMRLSEYRMCSGKVNNPLQHVTLFEEAHNLLQKQTAGSVEGSNMRAASVEMIASAIAEMRTYGQGFIIADQRPSLLDASVIANTRTKVYFAMSDESDRNIAGKSCSLSMRQQEELVRLNPGEAVLFQNGWSGAVLCKVNYFRPENAYPFIHQKDDIRKQIRECISQGAALLLLGRLENKEASSVDSTKVDICRQRLSCLDSRKAAIVRESIDRYHAGDKPNTQLHYIAARLELLLDVNKAISKCKDSFDIEKWANAMHTEIKRNADLSLKEIQLVTSIGIQARIKRNPEYRKLYVRYLSFCMKDAN